MAYNRNSLSRLPLSLVCTLGMGAVALAQYPILDGQIILKDTGQGPLDLTLNQEESNTHMVLLKEQSKFSIPGPMGGQDDQAFRLNIDVETHPLGQSMSYPGGPTSNRRMDEGLEVDVWLVHQDTESSASVRLEATIDFGAEIIGVQYRRVRLNIGDSTALLGNQQVVYPTGQSGRASNWENAGDELTIDANHRFLKINLKTRHGDDHMDELRVFTRPFTAGPFETFCDGFQGCPCSNDSVGTGAGCLNSSGRGGLLSYQGSHAIAQGPLDLTVSGLPNGVFGIVFMGQGRNLSPMGFGEGLLCVQPGPNGPTWGQGFKRLPVRHAGVFGSFSINDVVSITNQLYGASTIVPGSTWYFQGFYRDTRLMGCNPTHGFNLTNAFGVTFE